VRYRSAATWAACCRDAIYALPFAMIAGAYVFHQPDTYCAAPDSGSAIEGGLTAATLGADAG
jgi:hypothetical protein